MNNSSLEKKIQKWADAHAANGEIDRRDAVRKVLHQLNFLQKKLYQQYEPSLPPNPSYLKRLVDWLDNMASEDNQQLALELASKLFFVGRDEIKSMYRSAFSGPIMRWLIDLEKLSIGNESLLDQLEKLLRETWFCPITDSMKINEFIHINNIKNEIDYRPDWHSLTKLGDQTAVGNYITDNKIKRIVLLEDNIATGSQSKNSIQFAADIGRKTNCPVLIVPLILCHQAIDTFTKMKLPMHVTIDPVLLLEKHHFILNDCAENTAAFNEYKKLAEQTYLQVTNGVPPGRRKPYGPLGFGKTGGFLILATNTPDNTLPLVHWTSATWNPLFPRHSRV